MDKNMEFLRKWSDLLTGLLTHSSDLCQPLPASFAREATELLNENTDNDIWIEKLSAALSLLPWETFCVICAFLYEYSPQVRHAFGGAPSYALCLDLYETCFPLINRLQAYSSANLSRIFAQDGINSGLPLKLPAALFQLLCGYAPFHEGCLHQIYTDVPAPITDGDTAGKLLELCRGAASGAPLVLQLSGPAGSGKFYQMQYLSCRTGLPLLSVDLNEFPESGGEADRLLEELSLELLLSPSLVCLLHYDSLPLHEKALRTLSRNTFFLCATAWKEQLLPKPDDGFLTMTLRLPIKNRTEQRELWLCYFHSLGIEPPSELSAICSQYSFSIGEIKQFCLAYAARKNYQLSGDDFSLDGLIRENLAGQLPDGLARMVRPMFTWDDLVLEPSLENMLRHICRRSQYQEKVLDAWGYGRALPYGRGMSLLFCGPSGTGKTMTAHVIANELKTAMLYVDLSNILNKYIGETEKNLRRLFHQAGNMHAVLFFDEADSLFAKRTSITDSKDRAANQQTSFLLQAIEEYDGIVILSTNLPGNLDPAFIRRISYILKFQQPDEARRLLLWKTVFPPQAPLGPDVKPEILARLELSPAAIKNISLTAAYLAAGRDEITMEHLNEALKLEMQKTGSGQNCPESFHCVHGSGKETLW